MRIALIQVDGKLPNLALMKLSAYHKARGDDVILYRDPDDYLLGRDLFNPIDKAYAAVVFRENRKIGLKLARAGANIGGTGWWLYKSLPSEIEAMKPDYDLYGIDYGFGYLSRGCIRRCGPCVVWRKEGYIHHVAWPEELINPRSKEIVIMDGLFNGSPYWKEKAQWFIDNDYKIDINQGMDIRLINEEAAAIISALKHSGYIHFAFDHDSIEPVVRNGIELLLKQGIHPNRLMFYVIVNYDSTLKQDLRRIEILEEYGVNPYVMIYKKEKAPQKIRDLQRWCNAVEARRSCKFKDYKPRKGEGEICADFAL